MPQEWAYVCPGSRRAPKACGRDSAQEEVGPLCTLDPSCFSSGLESEQTLPGSQPGASWAGVVMGVRGGALDGKYE